MIVVRRPDLLRSTKSVNDIQKLAYILRRTTGEEFLDFLSSKG
jgi:hypothetical protein